ncbi:hypothetical protein EYC80_007495 [Monilinia laxa]|uniref:Uncharacterized protein n=1 Tax=Monilinia laxa TaxID=61186 RepID=A0A5N6JW34_MONLA|nr:hypothetical protein EYC80_007495 [Monilinia laxa]
MGKVAVEGSKGNKHTRHGGRMEMMYSAREPCLAITFGWVHDFTLEQVPHGEICITCCPTFHNFPIVHRLY